MTDLYISPIELFHHVNDESLSIIDARASLDSATCGLEMWKTSHIPKSVHADWLTDWGQIRNGVKGMLLDSLAFSRFLSRLCIGAESSVVIYDDNRLLTASRLAWAFLVYGYDNVAVLDGGFPAWEALGLPTQSINNGSENVASKRLSNPVDAAQSRAHVLKVEMADVREAVDKGTHQIVDCRWSEVLKSSNGRIPGATSLDSSLLLNDSGRYKTVSEVEELAVRAKIGKDGPTILYCGMGVSAAAVFIALRNAGFRRLSVYDGSWSEWSMYLDNPKEA